MLTLVFVKLTINGAKPSYTSAIKETSIVSCETFCVAVAVHPFAEFVAITVYVPAFETPYVFPVPDGNNHW